MEDGARHDATVGQLLYFTPIVQIPNDHLHISTCCQQVVLVGLFRAPIDVEDVFLVPVFKLFEGHDSRVFLPAVKQSCRVTLVIVHRQDLVDTQYAVPTTSRQILAILAKLDCPNGLITHFKMVQVLQVSQLSVWLLNDLRLQPEHLRNTLFACETAFQREWPGVARRSSTYSHFLDIIVEVPLAICLLVFVLVVQNCTLVLFD